MEGNESKFQGYGIAFVSGASSDTLLLSNGLAKLFFCVIMNAINNYCW